MSHHDDAGQSETPQSYSVDFTSVENSAPVFCERETCPTKKLAPGTKLHFLHSNDPRHPGRMVCLGCYDYYMRKQTTTRRTSSNAPGKEHRREIHQHIAQAQRSSECQ